MKRIILAVVAVACLASGGGLMAFGNTESILYAASGSLIRIGLVLGAIWLAMPHLVRIPPWFGQLLLVASLIVAARPRAAWVLVPVVAAAWVLRPRRGKSGGGAAPPS